MFILQITATIDFFGIFKKISHIFDVFPDAVIAPTRRIQVGYVIYQYLFSFIIHFFDLRVNTSSRASFHGVRYTSFSARCAKAGLYLSAWQARRLIVSYHSRL